MVQLFASQDSCSGFGRRASSFSEEKGLYCCPEMCDKEKKISSQSRGSMIEEDADRFILTAASSHFYSPANKRYAILLAGDGHYQYSAFDHTAVPRKPNQLLADSPVAISKI